MYDPGVKLWLGNFDQFDLSENQISLLTLGYDNREFSTQDIIDRLGITDVDKVREIITPLRYLGIVVRSKTHQQAYNLAKKNKVGKRNVPCYQVVSEPLASTEFDEQAEQAEIEESKNTLHLFVGGLYYQTVKET